MEDPFACSMLAAAVAVVIMLSLVLSGVFSPSVATGFAQVRERMERVRTISFDLQLEVPGAPTVVLRQMIRNDGRSRKQYSDGRYVVVERSAASLDAFSGESRGKNGASFLRHFPRARVGSF